MNEKMLEDLKDLRFTFTDKMKDLTIQMLYIKQMLDENNNLNEKERKMLKKEFDKLLKIFRIEFQAHNQIQVQFMRAYLGIK